TPRSTTFPACTTRPWPAARTEAPIAAARSTPRCPAAYRDGGGSKPVTISIATGGSKCGIPMAPSAGSECVASAGETVAVSADAPASTSAARNNDDNADHMLDIVLSNPATGTPVGTDVDKRPIGGWMGTIA